MEIFFTERLTIHNDMQKPHQYSVISGIRSLTGEKKQEKLYKQSNFELTNLQKVPIRHTKVDTGDLNLLRQNKA